MNWNALLADGTKRTTRSSVREFIKVMAQPGMISFAGGLPAPELFPVDAVGEAVKQMLRKHSSRALQYGEAEGIGELRDWIAAEHSTATLRLTRENVLILTGSQQGLDLVGRTLINRGDRVALENPTYIAALSAWRPLGAEFVSIPSDEEGPQSAAVAQAVNGAKLLYLIPNFQNPTGRTIAHGRRAEILSAAARAEAALVEDNPYGELRYEGEPIPHLFQMARGGGEDRVIYLGSFSKTLVPGLRVGFMIAPPEVLEHAIRCKQAIDLHTSTFAQCLILEMIESGIMSAHVQRLREHYKERRDTMLEALTEHMPPGIAWTRPAGGFFIFATLPHGVAAKSVLPRALSRSVAFVPGDEFHIDGSVGNTMRLNFSNPSPDQIRRGVRALAEAIRQTMQSGEVS